MQLSQYRFIPRQVQIAKCLLEQVCVMAGFEEGKLETALLTFVGRLRARREERAYSLKTAGCLWPVRERWWRGPLGEDQ